MEIHVRKNDYQDRFLSCQSKFPCLKAGIGSGKTLLMLVKVYRYCEQYPETSALVVRKTFTDLRDSTLKDFQQYFQCTVGSDKNYSFRNKSKIMFRHADELEVLKNLNLGIAAIEQAEEFENDTQFQFIRDRLRQQNGAKVRPLIVIANANGHNWIHQLWISGADREEIDASTGQFHYKRGEYQCLTADTFANARNLPPDFITDCRAKEIEAPNHYRQYVLNDDTVTSGDDFVFTMQELEQARKTECASQEAFQTKIVAFDISRYGNDKCAAICIQEVNQVVWRQIFLETWEKKDAAYTQGRIIATAANLQADGKVIDEDGIGGPVLDNLNAHIRDHDDQYKGFRNPNLSYEDDKFFGNPRTAMAFKLKDMIAAGRMIGLSEDVCQELLQLRYTYKPDGRRILISKEKLRAEGVKSPDRADSLLMAVSLIGSVRDKWERRYHQQPAYASEKWNPFENDDFKYFA